MNGDERRWSDAVRIFEEATAVPEGEREGLLDHACAGDPALLREVRSLLAADAADGLLDAPLDEATEPLFPEPLAHPGDDPMLGRHVGPYRVVALLGRGGMGSVYLAERADGSFEREVALKVVRGGLGSKALEAHFLRERRILARLEHPGIARLLDAGLTEEGSPYLVMERVHGTAITEYAEARGLDLDARLALFEAVLDAVRYAHRNLIVHRDLKPSNVMVTADGQVRLLDFGIARMLGDEFEEGDAATRTGLLLLTPDYAAPEQVRGEPATTATDVYALGCLLHELLCGDRPRRLAGMSWTGIERALSADDLPLPSMRAPALDRGRLRGDLDTIVLKSLRADPLERYPSADALASDLERHRRGLPVLARPASAAYRLRKFLRRHRVGAAAASLVGLATAVGVVGTLWQARAAAQEARRADAVSTFLFDLFEAASPEMNRGRVPDARELVDLGVARLDEPDATVGPELRLVLLTTLGSLYGKLGVYDQQATLLGRAVEESRSHYGDDDGRTGRALTGLGIALTELGRLAEADSVLRDARRVREGAGVADTLLAETVSAQATVASALGDTERALALHREALALDVRNQGEDGLRVAADLNNVGGQLIEVEEFDEAEATLERALTIRRTRLGEDHPEVAVTLGLLGQLHAALGDRPEAERFHREALAVQRRVYPAGHPDVARSLDQLAITVEVQGRYGEADSLYQEALALRREWLGETHPDVASTLNNMAVLRYRMGRYADAASSMEGALGAWRAALGDRHVNVATGLNNLGTMRRELGDYPGAERALSEALELRRELRGERHTDVGATLANLAGVLRLTGRLPEAESDYRAALSVLEENLPPEHVRVADAAWGLGATLVDAGRADEALPFLERALAIRERAMPATDPRVAEARLWRAAAWVRLGRAEEARPELGAARDALVTTLGVEAPAARRAAAELARIRP